MGEKSKARIELERFWSAAEDRRKTRKDGALVHEEDLFRKLAERSVLAALAVRTSMRTSDVEKASYISLAWLELLPEQEKIARLKLDGQYADALRTFLGLEESVVDTGPLFYSNGVPSRESRDALHAFQAPKALLESAVKVDLNAAHGKVGVREEYGAIACGGDEFLGAGVMGFDLEDDFDDVVQEMELGDVEALNRRRRQRSALARICTEKRLLKENDELRRAHVAAMAASANRYLIGAGGGAAGPAMQAFGGGGAGGSSGSSTTCGISTGGVGGCEGGCASVNSSGSSGDYGGGSSALTAAAREKRARDARTVRHEVEAAREVYDQVQARLKPPESLRGCGDYRPFPEGK